MPVIATGLPRFARNDGFINVSPRNFDAQTVYCAFSRWAGELPLTLAAEDDTRVAVDMPAMMRTHMLANMRDHLTAIQEIQASLAAGEYDAAAEIAESASA
jgi:hypothetical protein